MQFITPGLMRPALPAAIFLIPAFVTYACWQKIRDHRAFRWSFDRLIQQCPQLRRERRIARGLGQHGGPDDNFAARVALAVVALLDGEERQTSGFELLLTQG